MSVLKQLRHTFCLTKTHGNEASLEVRDGEDMAVCGVKNAEELMKGWLIKLALFHFLETLFTSLVAYIDLIVNSRHVDVSAIARAKTRTLYILWNAITRRLTMI